MKASLLVIAGLVACATCFVPSSGGPSRGVATFFRPSFNPSSIERSANVSPPIQRKYRTATSTALQLTLSESDQTVVGVTGTAMALVTLYSEYTLKTTGCGLPAGPLGLVGAVEGISYLGIVGIAAYSLYTKVRTGSGLPAGPAGVLGAAEGLSFLAIAAGLVVLGFQVLDYGYIPNAVPMEGGMCT